MRPRPASAGTEDPRFPISGECHIEQALLCKIRLFAEHHARNVQALRRLRSTRGVTGPPPPYDAINPVRTTRGMSKDDSELNCSRGGFQFTPPNRFFTRVVDASPTSAKLQPTVVEPFRSMETHAIAWKRKMRKQEELDLQMKKDEAEARDRDRKRLISAINVCKEFSGVITRSNEMMERRRQRIAEAEEQKENDGRSREFKARPVHIADEDWQSIKDRQNLRRKQRIQMRKELMSSISHLPRRMAMHELKRKAAADSMAEITDKREKTSESEVRTKNRSIPPEQIREVLARRQLLWDKKLAECKRKKKPVIPQVLPMEEREKIYGQRAQNRTRQKQNNYSSEKSMQLHRREKALSPSRVPVVPRSTHSFLLKTAQVRAKLEKESNDLKRQKKEELERHSRQQAMSKTISEAIRRMESQQGRLARRATVAEARRRARESQERYRFQLKENQQKLEQAIRDAPLLWERHDAELRKEAAKRIALSTIAQRVFGPGSIDSERDNWRGSATDKIFDGEERAVFSRAN